MKRLSLLLLPLLFLSTTTKPTLSPKAIAVLSAAPISFVISLGLSSILKNKSREVRKKAATCRNHCVLAQEEYAYAHSLDNLREPVDAVRDVSQMIMMYECAIICGNALGKALADLLVN